MGQKPTNSETNYPQLYTDIDILTIHNERENFYITSDHPRLELSKQSIYFQGARLHPQNFTTEISNIHMVISKFSIHLFQYEGMAKSKLDELE